MRTITRAFAGISALIAAACASPPKCPEAPAVAPSASPSSAPIAAPNEPKGPRLAITIKPKPGAPSVDVEVRATSDEGLDQLSLAIAAGPEALRIRDAHDARGAIAASPARAPDGRVIVALPRKAEGELSIAYSVNASPPRSSAIPGVDPDANRFVSSGEPLLLLPDALDDRPVHATIEIAFDAYVADNGGRSMVDGASSFGAGRRREVTARGRELRRGIYLAGSIGRAIFDTVEGQDEAVWLGYTSFDPRPIAADIAAFRTAARELFRGGDEAPFALLIVPDGRTPGSFTAARRARSVLVHLGAGEPWTAPVRIAVVTEVLRAWIGERLWVGPDDPAHEAEAYWFTEGVARHLARDLLFRFGLITPRELTDEIHGAITVALTSPRRAEGNAELASHVKEPAALPLLTARGALYATALNARIKAATKGKKSLDDVLRALLAKAKEARRALSVSAWLDAVRAETGAPEEPAFAKSIGEGKVEDPRDDALGPCFRKASRTFEAFDLGFDEAASRKAAAITGLRAGGPAARAGLFEGDKLIDAAITRGRSDVKVTIAVDRKGDKVTVSYLPAGARAKGAGFTRKNDVPDDACAK